MWNDGRERSRFGRYFFGPSQAYICATVALLATLIVIAKKMGLLDRVDYEGVTENVAVGYISSVLFAVWFERRSKK